MTEGQGKSSIAPTFWKWGYNYLAIEKHNMAFLKRNNSKDCREILYNVLSDQGLQLGFKS